MSYFPFFIELNEKICLVVGGGNVAYRKAKSMVEFGATVKVVAESVGDCFYSLQKQNQEKIFLNEKSFEPEDLQGVFCVIAATDDSELNQTIAKLCDNMKILVNIVDVKELCSFIVPSIVKKDDLVVGVSTGGNSPVIAREIRKSIENNMPEKIGEINSFMGSIRERVKKRISSPDKRQHCFEKLYETSLEKKRPLTQSEADEIISDFATESE